MKWNFLNFFFMMNTKEMKRLGVNVYNQKSIPTLYQTKEHIIPKSIFRRSTQANHWKNLISCDKYTNTIRTDYRLGDPLTYKDLFIEYRENQSFKQSNTLVSIHNKIPYKLVIDSTGNVSGVLDRIQRIFYPSLDADMGLLSRSIIDMLHQYPYLYSSMDRIVSDVRLLHNYYDLPKTNLEIEREILYDQK
jgi:hypothetical protein